MFVKLLHVDRFSVSKIHANDTLYHGLGIHIDVSLASLDRVRGPGACPLRIFKILGCCLSRLSWYCMLIWKHVEIVKISITILFSELSKLQNIWNSWNVSASPTLILLKIKYTLLQIRFKIPVLPEEIFCYRRFSWLVVTWINLHQKTNRTH